MIKIYLFPIVVILLLIETGKKLIKTVLKNFSYFKLFLPFILIKVTHTS
jgi:hypothetical protein